MRRILPLSLAAAALLGACQDAPGPVAPTGRTAARADATPAAAAARSIPDEYVVAFQSNVQDAPGLARRLVAAQGGTLRFTYQYALKGFAAHLTAQAAAAIAASPQVASVEQDQVATAFGSVENPAPSWGLDRIDQRSGTDGKYSYTGNGAGVTAYIIDTGIDASNSDFGGRASVGVDEVGDGRNGVDCNGHGTHVAGTVGGATYGVAKGVTIVAVRVLDCSGSGTYAGVIAGIDWVTGNHQAGTPAVANMSLGGGFSSTVDNAVENSIADGVAYAVAAGNGDFLGRAQDACNYSPAATPDAMTIGATDNSDRKASWSNYGNCVDWFAPGVNITSDWLNGGTNTISGTSMATPHTTGVAALYLAAYPTATPQQVRDALAAAADKGVVTSSNTANNDLLYSPPDGWGGSPPADQPPTAAFVWSCSYLDCSFTDTSTGTVTGRAWTFGDNGTSTDANPTHTYAALGTYTVTLQVFDGPDVSSTATQNVTVSAPPPPPPIALSASNGSHGAWSIANLSWSGANGSRVDIYRKNSDKSEPPSFSSDLLTTTSNDGQYSDRIGKGIHGTWTENYIVCEHGSTTACSNLASVSF